MFMVLSSMSPFITKEEGRINEKALYQVGGSGNGQRTELCNCCHCHCERSPQTVTAPGMTNTVTVHSAYKYNLVHSTMRISRLPLNAEQGYRTK